MPIPEFTHYPNSLTAPTTFAHDMDTMISEFPAFIAAMNAAGVVGYARVNSTQAVSPVTLTVGQCAGFNTFTNTGASGAVTLLLPAGFDNAKLKMIVTAAQDFIATANGTETIRYIGNISIAGGSIKAAVIGYILTLEWSGTQWIAETQGLWSLETS